jgi:hypothetical protein
VGCDEPPEFGIKYWQGGCVRVPHSAEGDNVALLAVES